MTGNDILISNYKDGDQENTPDYSRTKASLKSEVI